MTKTIPNGSRAKFLAALQALITGLQKQFPGGQFTLRNTPFSTAELVALLQGVVDALNALTEQEAASRTAVANAKAKVANAKPTISALTRNLLSMFDSAPSILAVFGLEPPKAKAQPTVEEKAAAKAKAKATRTARGTVGAKAKAAIKGNVTGVEITPITAPATPTSEPSAQAATTTPTAPSTGTTGK